MVRFIKDMIQLQPLELCMKTKQYTNKNTKARKEEMQKVNLLQDNSIRHLYQKKI
jgi:hypothetical protein